MESSIRATLTRTYRGEPLAVLDGLPGGAAELTPAQLRALARTLTEIAAACEDRPKRRGVILTETRDFPLAGT
jgi:hypothetical protein